MNTATPPINPFYAARQRRVAPTRHDEPPRTVYARLPRAPITGSPVPHLTSLYHFCQATVILTPLDLNKTHLPLANLDCRSHGPLP